MLIRRIGTFFILIGAGLLLIFLVSMQAAARNNALYLLAGLACILFGGFLRNRGPKPPSDLSSRFRILRGRNREESHGEDSSQNRDHFH